MSEIVLVEIKNGLIHAQDSDGFQYEIWIDDHGVPRSGRTNTWAVPEAGKPGHIVEILLPVGPNYPVLPIPLRVTVRHADEARP